MSNPTPKKRRSFWASAYVALHRKEVRLEAVGEAQLVTDR